MINYLSLILLFAGTTFWSQAYATHRSDITNAAVEVVHDTFKKVLENAPEPFRSEALTKLEEARNKGWESTDDYFAEVSEVFKELDDKTRSKRAVFKPESNPALLAVKEEMMKEEFVWTLTMDSTPLEKPILMEKFNEALEMKFASIEDFAKYCVKVYKEVTGKTANYHDAMNFDKSDETV